MHRLGPAALVALAVVAAWPSGVAVGALTPRNSVVAPLVMTQPVTIAGVGCGVVASGTALLPAGASDVQVRRPVVGERDPALTATVTAVSVQNGAVVVSAVADGDVVCDPGESSTPPAQRPWSAAVPVEAALRQRLGVVHFNRDRVRGRPFVARPAEVRIGYFVAARGLRWTRFGGRTAIALGRFRSLTPCAGGCSDNGTLLRVVLSRPGRCPGLRRQGQTVDAVFYTKVAFVLRQRLGILRPGREWISTRLTCPPGGTPPILIP